jgi:hypothetical protein
VHAFEIDFQLVRHDRRIPCWDGLFQHSVHVCTIVQMRMAGCDRALRVLSRLRDGNGPIGSVQVARFGLLKRHA